LTAVGGARLSISASTEEGTSDACPAVDAEVSEPDAHVLGGADAALPVARETATRWAWSLPAIPTCRRHGSCRSADPRGSGTTTRPASPRALGALTAATTTSSGSSRRTTTPGDAGHHETAFQRLPADSVFLPLKGIVVDRLDDVNSRSRSASSKVPRWRRRPPVGPRSLSTRYILEPIQSPPLVGLLT
jgi:hypothetical protein